MKVRAVSVHLSVAGLQRLNSYRLTGTLERSGKRLDDLVIDHLACERAMARLSPQERMFCRCAVEGWKYAEIARAMRVSERTVARLAHQMRWTLYGVDADDALAKTG